MLTGYEGQKGQGHYDLLKIEKQDNNYSLHLDILITVQIFKLISHQVFGLSLDRDVRFSIRLLWYNYN